MTLSYKTSNVNDVELVYSLLKEKHASKQIDIQFNNSTKEYILSVTDKPFVEDPEIPIDVKIKVQYGDTDSIMIKMSYNRDDYRQNRIDTFKLGTLCGDKLTHEIFNRPPIEMEFEKVFQPFILLSKKRYIGRKYDNMKDPFEMTKLVTSGIALTRRDYCKMVKKCYKDVLDVIVEMKENNINVIDVGINIFKKCIDDIMNYKINFDDLIVTALLAKSYKTRPVHLILAEKLKARNEEVQIGSRIPYIYIEDTSGMNKMKSELGEDPDYAKRNNLKYNRLCYLEQLAKPLLSFFCIILKDFDDKSDDLINYVNKKITSIGGKKLKESDFKLFTSDE
jgi:DNA polymerase delta subunit 1